MSRGETQTEVAQEGSATKTPTPFWPVPAGSRQKEECSRALNEIGATIQPRARGIALGEKPVSGGSHSGALLLPRIADIRFCLLENSRAPFGYPLRRLQRSDRPPQHIWQIKKQLRSSVPPKSIVAMLPIVRQNLLDIHNVSKYRCNEKYPLIMGHRFRQVVVVERLVPQLRQLQKRAAKHFRETERGPLPSNGAQ